MKQFFNEPPRPDHQRRNTQKEIAVDYRLCHEAMGAGHQDDRQYLAIKYNRTINSVGDLYSLGGELFARLDSEERAFDLYDTERKLAEYDAT